MTTIACDGKSMVGDGRQTSGDYNHLIDTIKIKKLSTGDIAGWCGALNDAYAVVEWLERGRPEDSKPTNLDCTILLYRDGKLFRLEDRLIEVEVGIPAAIGSGRLVAIGAMLAGASARTAVEIASIIDPFTGGKLSEISLNGP